MKKIYKEPKLRIIDLEAEQMIALSQETFDVDASQETEDRFTEKQNMWDRESIWK